MKLYNFLLGIIILLNININIYSQELTALLPPKINGLWVQPAQSKP